MGKKTESNGGSVYAAPRGQSWFMTKPSVQPNRSVFFLPLPVAAGKLRVSTCSHFSQDYAMQTHNEINVLKRFGSWYHRPQNMGAYNLQELQFATIQVIELKIIQCKFQTNVLRRKRSLAIHMHISICYLLSR